jgi:endogenous inhibitor of DNA gyrase (YacG/DUF329 family)
MGTLSEEARAYFREAVARRRREPRACVSCGGSFEGLRFQRFCSKRCADREMQRRARERQRAQRATAEEQPDPTAP